MNKKQTAQQLPTSAKNKPKQPQNTPEMKVTCELRPLTIIDTTPTMIQNITQIERMIYCIPKIAIKGPEITDEQAENVDEDDLFEHFRNQRVFVVYGTPITYNEQTLEYIFSQYGKVESVFFHPSNDLFSRIAEVTMTTEEGYKTVFAESSKPITLNSQLVLSQQIPHFGTSPAAFGISKWNQEYNQLRPDHTTLQEQCDNFMNSYDDRENKVKKTAKRQEVVDDDGFTLVIDRHGDVNRNERREQAVVKQKQKRHNEKMRQKTENGLQFYRFHEVQQNRKEQQILQRSQHADSKIIHKMQQKSFKPL